MALTPPVPVPTRETSEQDLDRFNRWLRGQPVYQSFLRAQGIRDGASVKLDDRQQEALEQLLAAHGIELPGGMHVDQGGNLNQNNRLVRNVAIGAAATGVTLFGVPGLFPGLLSPGAAPASGLLPTTGWTPPLAPHAGTALGLPTLGPVGGNLAQGAFSGFWKQLGFQGIGAGLDLFGNWMQSRAANEASENALAAQTDANRTATELTREQLDESRRQHDEEMAILRLRHDAEQAELNRKASEENRQTAEEQRRFDMRQTQLAPYREQGAISLRELAARASQPTPPSRVPMPAQRDLMAGHINNQPGANQPGVVTMRELANGATQAPQTSGFTLNVADLDPRWRRTS